MSKLVTSILFLTLPFLLLAESKRGEADIPVVNFKQLQPLLEKENDTVYVVNFWATYCAPCVKEIPYFEQLGEKNRDKKLKILMVSLDMKSQLESKLIPYVKKHSIQNQVILLDDVKFNDWILLVDKEWTGARPATHIYGNGFREFHAGEITFKELEDAVLPHLSD